MKKLLLAMAAAVILTAPARAADIPAPPPVMAAVYNWTGFYIGAHAGYGWSDADFVIQPATDISHDGQGFILGGQVGYNWRATSNLVLGVEVDADYADIKGSIACPNAIFRCRDRLNSLVSARGRLGFLVTPQALFYGTAGGAWGHAEYSAVRVATGLPNAGGFQNSTTHTGWVAGGGIEYKFDNSWSLKAEYLHYGFSGKTLDCTPLPAGSSTFCNFEPTVHTVKFGFNWFFNVPGAVVARY